MCNSRIEKEKTEEILTDNDLGYENDNDDDDGDDDMICPPQQQTLSSSYASSSNFLKPFFFFILWFSKYLFIYSRFLLI